MTTMRKRRPSYFHHMRQPNGFTCGSTCVRMAASILLDRQDAQLHLGPHEVAGMMGTNPQTGTTEIEMKRGLDMFGIPHERMPLITDADGIERLDDLFGWLRAGNMAMLRCLVGGMKHWILAVAVNDRGALVLDPAYSIPKTLGPRDIAERIAPRGWEIWKIPGDAPCRDLTFGRLVRFRSEPLDIDRAAIKLLQEGGDLDRRLVPADACEYLVQHVMDHGRSFGLWDGDRLLAVHAGSRRPSWQILTDAGIRMSMEMNSRLHTIMDLAPGALFQSLVTAVHPDMRGLGAEWLMEAAPGLHNFACVHGIERAGQADESSDGAEEFRIEQGGLRYFIRMAPAWYGSKIDFRAAMSADMDEGPAPGA